MAIILTPSGARIDTGFIKGETGVKGGLTVTPKASGKGVTHKYKTPSTTKGEYKAVYWRGASYVQFVPDTPKPINIEKQKLQQISRETEQIDPHVSLGYKQASKQIPDPILQPQQKQASKQIPDPILQPQQKQESFHQSGGGKFEPLQIRTSTMKPVPRPKLTTGFAIESVQTEIDASGLITQRGSVQIRATGPVLFEQPEHGSIPIIKQQSLLKISLGKKEYEKDLVKRGIKYKDIKGLDIYSKNILITAGVLEGASREMKTVGNKQIAKDLGLSAGAGVTYQTVKTAGLRLAQLGKKKGKAAVPYVGAGEQIFFGALAIKEVITAYSKSQSITEFGSLISPSLRAAIGFGAGAGATARILPAPVVKPFTLRQAVNLKADKMLARRMRSTPSRFKAEEGPPFSSKTRSTTIYIPKEININQQINKNITQLKYDKYTKTTEKIYDTKTNKVYYDQVGSQKVVDLTQYDPLVLKEKAPGFDVIDLSTQQTIKERQLLLIKPTQPKIPQSFIEPHTVIRSKAASDLKEFNLDFKKFYKDYDPGFRTKSEIDPYKFESYRKYKVGQEIKTQTRLTQFPSIYKTTGRGSSGIKLSEGKLTLTKLGKHNIKISELPSYQDFYMKVKSGKSLKNTQFPSIYKTSKIQSKSTEGVLKIYELGKPKMQFDEPFTLDFTKISKSKITAGRYPGIIKLSKGRQSNLGEWRTKYYEDIKIKGLLDFEYKTYKGVEKTYTTKYSTLEQRFKVSKAIIVEPIQRRRPTSIFKDKRGQISITETEGRSSKSGQSDYLRSPFEKIKLSEIKSELSSSPKRGTKPKVEDKIEVKLGIIPKIRYNLDDKNISKIKGRTSISLKKKRRIDSTIKPNIKVKQEPKLKQGVSYDYETIKPNRLITVSDFAKVPDPYINKPRRIRGPRRKRDLFEEIPETTTTNIKIPELTRFTAVKKPKKLKKPKRVTRFLPSLAAVEFKIKGKRPKYLTGFEARPIGVTL